MAEDLRKRFTVKIDSIKVYNDKSLAAFSQGDVKTAILNIELTENDTALDLTGKKVRASFRKADGKNVMQDMTTGVSITDAIGGKVQVELSTQVLAAKGNVRGQLSITDEAAGLVAETVEFAFTVRESLLNEAIVSLNELPIVEKMVEAAEILETVDMEAIIENNERMNDITAQLAQRATEIDNAKGTFPTLLAKLDNMVIEGGGAPSNVILFEDWISGETVTVDTTTGPDVTAPVLMITPNGNTFPNTQVVTMSTNETADIYYTLDGSTPTAASTKYTGAITLSATTILKVFAKDTAGNSSAVQTVTFTKDVTAPADTTAPVLTITPAATFTDTQTVTMSTNETATIWYTLDDSDPKTSGTKLQYTAPLTLTATDTIKAYAVDSAYNASAVQTVTYTKQAATVGDVIYIENGYLSMPADIYNDYTNTAWSTITGHESADYIAVTNKQDTTLQTIFDRSGLPTFLLSDGLTYEPYVTNMTGIAHEAYSVPASGSQINRLILWLSKTKGATSTDIVAYMNTLTPRIKYKLATGYKTYTVPSNISTVTTRTASVDTAKFEYFKCTLLSAIPADYVPQTSPFSKAFASNGYFLTEAAGYVFSDGNPAIRLNADNTFEMLLPKGTLATIDVAGVSAYLAAANIKIYYV
jgi:hypothetical protein